MLSHEQFSIGKFREVIRQPWMFESSTPIICLCPAFRGTFPHPGMKLSPPRLLAMPETYTWAGNRIYFLLWTLFLFTLSLLLPQFFFSSSEEMDDGWLDNRLFPSASFLFTLLLPRTPHHSAQNRLKSSNHLTRSQCSNRFTLLGRILAPMYFYRSVHTTNRSFIPSSGLFFLIRYAHLIPRTVPRAQQMLTLPPSLFMVLRKEMCFSSVWLYSELCLSPWSPSVASVSDDSILYSANFVRFSYPLAGLRTDGRRKKSRWLLVVGVCEMGRASRHSRRSSSGLWFPFEFGRMIFYFWLWDRSWKRGWRGLRFGY